MLEKKKEEKKKEGGGNKKAKWRNTVEITEENKDAKKVRGRFNVPRERNIYRASATRDRG